jgi:hypothetical protein
VPPLELLLHGDPPLVQHTVHALLEGVLALLQLFMASGQVGVGLVDQLLPALEGLPLPVEPVFEGMELLFSAAQLPFAVANFGLSHGEPNLLQAQALRARVCALLANVKEGLAILGFLQPLPCVGKEAVGVGPGLVQEVLSRPLCLSSSQGWIGRPNGGRSLWRASEMISMASWCALAKTSLADSFALARTSSAFSAALARISSAYFLAYSRRSAARWSRRRHLSVAWCRRAQPLLRRASSAARALATPLRRAPVMAASTPVHASSASAWGSVVILSGLPKISGRGGDGALEGPGSVEVAPLSLRGAGAVLSPVGAAGAAGGASGVQVVLAIVGAAGDVPVVSGMPPALGGSVVSGAGVAPAVDGASADVRSSSSPAARGGVAGVAVDAESGPSVVWLVFLFFLLFFSSFFSSASLGRRKGEGVRKKVSQG